jgi:transcription elongation factor GreB
MSKAFVKDLDSEADLPYEPPAIPAGINNYMTSQGHCQMQDELHQPLRVERPKVVETVAWGGWERRSVGERRLYLRQTPPTRDRSAHPFLVDPAGERRGGRPQAAEEAGPGLFGATVTYADGRGNVKTITIVGIDEADLSRGRVSWVSPVARALMKAHEGNTVDVHAPSGVEQIEVLEIRYGGAHGETE